MCDNEGENGGFMMKIVFKKFMMKKEGNERWVMKGINK